MDPVLREDIAAGTLLAAKRCAGKQKEWSTIQEDSAQGDTAAIDNASARKRPRQHMAKGIGSVISSSSEDGRIAPCVQHQGEQITHRSRSVCSANVAEMVNNSFLLRAGLHTSWLIVCSQAH